MHKTMSPHEPLQADLKMEANSILFITAPVQQRTEILLSHGGDDRLTVNGNLMNKYLSSTFPRPDVIRRGSCTCSTISAEAYKSADEIRERLLAETLKELSSETAEESSGIQSISKVMISICDSIRQRLSLLLGFDGSSSKASLVMFPSGSDAEFLPLVVALIRSNAEGGNGVVYSYVTAAGEVGSGTPNAAGGRHFSVLAPRGNAQSNNGLLEGITSDGKERVVVISYQARDSRGCVNFQEEKLIADVRSKLEAKSNFVVLHIVCGSKTGLTYPSIKTVLTLKKEFSNRIVVVVDACQLRCRLSAVAGYAEMGFVSLVTGSKFFEGPPFSGAVVLPALMSEEIEGHLRLSREESLPGEQAAVPKGLRDYLTPYDVCASMPELRIFLTADQAVPSARPTQWYNAGLILRWSLGLSTMERYSSLPEGAVEAFTRTWVEEVKESIRAAGPHLVLLETESGLLDEDMVGSVNTIVSIGLKVRDATADTDTHSGTLKHLSFDEMKLFHLKMTLAVPLPSSLISALTDAEAGRHRAVLGAQVMLGQPVKLAETVPEGEGGVGVGTVVRIALGATMVIAALTHNTHTQAQDSVRAMQIEDQLVVQKMVMLAEHWGAIASPPIPLAPVPTTLVSTPESPVAADPLARTPLVHPSDIVSAAHGPDHGLLSRMALIDSQLGLDRVEAIEVQVAAFGPTDFTAAPSASKRSYPLLSKRVSTDATLISKALKALKKQMRGTALLDGAEDLPEVMVLYDMDALCNSFSSVAEAFSPFPCRETAESAQSSSALDVPANIFNREVDYLHCFAVKSCPLSYVLHRAVAAGLGLECASIMEVKHSLKVGCLPHRVVFDSPCKSAKELSFALRQGVHVNCNSLGELKKISAVLKAMEVEGVSCLSRIGLRINPLVGSGTIAALSTATQTSKFGVPLQPLPYPGDSQAARESVKSLFLAHPFLTGLMCHVGSQGMALSAMTEGVDRVIRLSREINTAAGEQRVSFVDIGGGLSVNYSSDEVTPTIDEYASSLRCACPDIFDRHHPNCGDPYKLTIITEFGKALVAKCGAIVTLVEDTVQHSFPTPLSLPRPIAASLPPVPVTDPSPVPSVSRMSNVMSSIFGAVKKETPADQVIDIDVKIGTEIGPSAISAMGSCAMTAIVHAGADLLLRTAYCPDKFTHRVVLLSSECDILAAEETAGPAGSEESLQAAADTTRPSRVTTIAGPLCFSGDVIIDSCVLPESRPGDQCVILDAGANTLSLFSRHCSRLAPVVCGFRIPKGSNEDVIVAMLKPAESEDQLLMFWN